MHCNTFREPATHIQKVPFHFTVCQNRTLYQGHSMKYEVSLHCIVDTSWCSSAPPPLPRPRGTQASIMYSIVIYCRHVQLQLRPMGGKNVINVRPFTKNLVLSATAANIFQRCRRQRLKIFSGFVNSG
jgi:hypothetical protein